MDLFLHAPISIFVWSLYACTTGPQGIYYIGIDSQNLIALSTTFGQPKENTYYRIHHYHLSPAVAEPISL